MKNKDILLNIIAAVLLPVYCVSCSTLTGIGTWIKGNSGTLNSLGAIASAVDPALAGPITLGLYGLEAAAGAATPTPSPGTIGSVITSVTGGKIAPTTVTALANAVSDVIAASSTPVAGLNASAAKINAVAAPNL